MYRQNIIIIFSAILFIACNSSTKPPSYLEKIESHYQFQMDIGLDHYGSSSTDFWMASLDTYYKRYPENLERPTYIPNRVYLDRFIDAPHGSNLYWDMPSMVLMYNLTQITGNEEYQQSAENYINAFLERCVAKNGVFLWGNHYFYDAFADSTVRFGPKPTPIDPDTEMGDHHEMRPLVPAWEIFWKNNPDVTEKEIRQSIQNHLVDKTTGQFNRHADSTGKHSFLEAGGVLIYSLSWLYDKTKDESLLETADKIINYSYSNRNNTTGLIANSPTSGRWDSFTSTTEVGLWVGCLLKASKWATKEYAENWTNIAEKAMHSWLTYGFDQNEKKYYGMLNIDDGKWIQKKDNYPYKPDNYANIWHPLFPRHDYPMSFAESCLNLYLTTKKEIYKESCLRWIDIIKEDLPARKGMGAYAEHYGRVIHFLLSCATEFDDVSCRDLAKMVANESINVLYDHDMFRSHPGENRYDAVDGVGILGLALLWLETNQKPEMMGLYF